MHTTEICAVQWDVFGGQDTQIKSEEVKGVIEKTAYWERDLIFSVNIGAVELAEHLRGLEQVTIAIKEKLLQVRNLQVLLLLFQFWGGLCKKYFLLSVQEALESSVRYDA